MTPIHPPYIREGLEIWTAWNNHHSDAPLLICTCEDEATAQMIVDVINDHFDSSAKIVNKDTPR